LLIFGLGIGVSKVDANLETKKVDVECDDSVDNEVLLAALKKWASNSGKTVEAWN
jgi:copper chaperone CopZ